MSAAPGAWSASLRPQDSASQSTGRGHVHPPAARPFQGRLGSGGGSGASVWAFEGGQQGQAEGFVQELCYNEARRVHSLSEECLLNANACVKADKCVSDLP